jgi:hypothetical protein
MPSAYLPILNIFVPQVAHVPVVAGLPFFIVIAVGFFISCFDLHLTQYASIDSRPPSGEWYVGHCIRGDTLDSFLNPDVFLGANRTA